MTEEQRDLLCRGLTRLGVPYTPEAVERLGLTAGGCWRKTR